MTHLLGMGFFSGRARIITPSRASPGPIAYYKVQLVQLVLASALFAPTTRIALIGMNASVRGNVLLESTEFFMCKTSISRYYIKLLSL